MTRSVAGVSGLKFRALLAVSTIAAAFAFAGAVKAADMIQPEPEVVADWTGFYLGIHGGVAGGEFEYPINYDVTDFRDGPRICGSEDGGDCGLDAEFELNSSGLFGGGQIGFNWQLNNLLLGIEADAAWTNLEGKLEADASTDLFGCDECSASLEAGSEVNWFATIRGRLGFLVTPSFLLYATGGAAVGEIESGFDISWCEGGTCDGIDDSTSETEWGWTAGAGAEYMITDHWTFKAEYLFVDLGKSKLLDEDNVICPGNVVCEDHLDIDVDTHFHTLKVGINFLF